MMINSFDCEKARERPWAKWFALAFLLSLFAIGFLYGRAAGAQDIRSNFCEPITLRGNIGFVGTDQAAQVLKVTWMARVTNAGNLTVAERVLEFPMSEVWTPYFLGPKRFGLAEITFLEKGCRPDRRDMNRLIAPLEFKHSDDS